MNLEQVNTGQKSVDADGCRPMLSVCVPIYNVARYLPDCVESICSQIDPTDSIEVLFCDDASTDSSLDVLQDTLSQFADVRASIMSNASNSGVSSTRNRLLEAARGDYVWFVDSDDMLLSGSMRLVLDAAAAGGFDGLTFRYERVDQNATWGGASQTAAQFSNWRTKPATIGTLANFDEFIPYDSNGVAMVSAWATVMRRDFLLSNRLAFRPDMRQQEDTAFFFEFYLHKPRMLKSSLPLVWYRQREGSLLHSSSTQMTIAWFNSLKVMVRLYQGYLDESERWCSTPEELGALEDRVLQAKMALALYAARLPDRGAYKHELKQMKREGMYPYPPKLKKCHGVVPTLEVFLAFQPILSLANASFGLLRKLGVNGI